MISLDVIYCYLYNQPEGEWYTWGLGGVERGEQGKDIKVQLDRKDGRQARRQRGWTEKGENTKYQPRNAFTRGYVGWRAGEEQFSCYIYKKKFQIQESSDKSRDVEARMK